MAPIGRAGVALTAEGGMLAMSGRGEAGALAAGDEEGRPAPIGKNGATFATGGEVTTPTAAGCGGALGVANGDTPPALPGGGTRLAVAEGAVGSIVRVGLTALGA
jgi:hypothetical protein